MHTASDVRVPRQYYMKRKGNDSSDNYVDLFANYWCARNGLHKCILCWGSEFVSRS